MSTQQMNGVEAVTTETASMPTPPIEVNVESGKTYWWCACGRSKQQPFCDGSHKGTQFAPLRYQATATGAILFCACKKTLEAPICSGLPPQCGR